MLTISQLAKYAGVSVRTVRWYHQRGLLPEPARDSSGYRRYDGQAVIDLVRISTLAGAGVPLARVGDLLEADEAEFRTAVTELDAELAERITELEQRRADLAQLPSAERLCVPDKVAELLDLERSIGVSERTIAMERDAWILLAATYPEMLDEVFAWKQLTTTDPAYQQLLLAMDEAYEWSADDPRLPAAGPALRGRDGPALPAGRGRGVRRQLVGGHRALQPDLRPRDGGLAGAGSGSTAWSRSCPGSAAIPTWS